MELKLICICNVTLGLVWKLKVGLYLVCSKIYWSSGCVLNNMPVMLCWREIDVLDSWSTVLKMATIKKNWAINLWTTQKHVWYGCNQFQSTRCFYELTQISMNRSLVFLYFNWGKVKSLTVVCQGTSTLNLCRRECIWLMMTYTDMPNKGLPK